MRFEHSVQWFRQKMSERAIGQPLLARATFVAPMLSSPRTWVDDPTLATGGPLADIGIHCIDTLRYVLADEVESVSMQAQYDSHSVLEASASGVLRFSRGTLANVAVSGRGRYYTLLEVAGENGVLSAVNALTVDHPVTLELRRGFEIVERTEVSNDDAYTLQLDAFAAAVEADGEFLIHGRRWAAQPANSGCRIPQHQVGEERERRKRRGRAIAASELRCISFERARLQPWRAGGANPFRLQAPRGRLLSG